MKGVATVLVTEVVEMLVEVILAQMITDYSSFDLSVSLVLSLALASV